MYKAKFEKMIKTKLLLQQYRHTMCEMPSNLAYVGRCLTNKSVNIAENLL